MNFTHLRMDNSGKILIIEDDKDINGLIAYNLKRAGFFVRQAFDGNRAAAILKDECFDVVLLDLMLPGIDGFQICRMVRDDPKAFRTFVIIVSARSQAEDKLYANILGAHYYLTKPFSMTGLMDIIHEIDGIRGRDFIVNHR